MDNEFLILAIHTPTKANILKSILEKNGIEVLLKRVGDTTDSFSVAVRKNDLSRSLSLIESNNLFRYNEKSTQLIDDGNPRILVAVDFSAYSMKACQMAFNLAKAINAKVKILHVYHRLFFPSQMPFADTTKETPEEEGLLNKTRNKMLRWCLDIDNKINAGEWPSVNYSYSLREGVVEDEIDNFVKEYNPILLVLGTRGKDDNQNYVLGGVTADLIEMTDIPILAVPEHSPINNLSDIKHIAFMTNLQNQDLTRFETLVNMLEKFTQVKISFVHINDPKKKDRWSESELVEIGENFKKKYPQVNVSYKLISSTEDFKQFIKTENVDIISATVRKRSLFRRMFVPSSVARELLLNLDITFLIQRG